MSADDCRLDVWLWRARFFKTRSLASRFVESGRIRLTRRQTETRVDKPAQTVKVDDYLVFAISGRLFSLKILSPGDRRGPAFEARTLYESMGQSGDLQNFSPPSEGHQR